MSGLNFTIGPRALQRRNRCYPNTDDTSFGGLIEWSAMEPRWDKHSSITWYVRSICAKCGKDRKVNANSITGCIKRGTFSNLCRSCCPNARSKKTLRKYLDKSEETLANGVVVRWATTRQIDRRFVVFVKCICGGERLVSIHQIAHSMCRRCSANHAMERNGRWNGGRSDANGYWMVYIPPNDPMISMAEITNKLGWGKVLEHRLVAARKIGRPLESWEHVHHRDGNKKNNLPDNLEILTPNEHRTVTMLQTEVYRLRRENKRLRKELGKPAEKHARLLSPPAQLLLPLA